ncbi:Riboflavin-aldehyde forming enzyme [Mycena sanguinolenta]|uniref:Riboflavin-aldehyde forming enzyme n=1 Tax=Mycena sanguinolenta TaxID=230812 RepID=A0A8H7CLI7_9AGAR|nr:Riboflavin-aldehyde forming enzyme [Mycena sanguinolenta]
MHFPTSFLSVVAALLVVGANANPVASPEADLNARTTIFSGDATWYTPDGNVGACGAPMQNSDFIVALSSAHYHDGAHCWQHLNVEYNGKNIDVTIGDLCPGCSTDGIDLSEGAFAALADLSVGVIPVQWNFK